MKSLTQIIRCLKPSEVRLIRKLYRVQPNGEDKKRLTLFEIILANKNITDQEAAEKLYNSKPNSAFSHIKGRLKNDILNFLIIHDASKKTDVSKYYQLELNCRKGIMQAELLLARGLYNEGEKLLLKILRTVIDYELFAEIIQIKSLLRITLGFRKGVTEYVKHSKNIDYYLSEYQKWLKVREYYYRLALPNQFQTNKRKELLQASSGYSDELDRLHTEDSSSRFRFHYYLFKVHHHNISQEFPQSLKYAKALVELVLSKPLLNKKPNISGTHMSLANVQINLSQYDKAIAAAHVAVENFKSGMVNELKALEVLFFAYLRKRDYKNATLIIHRSLTHKRIKSNKAFHARWQFFDANLAYILGDNEKAFKLLRQNNELLKDKSGWLFGFKLFEMMLTIDEKDWYWLGFQLNNFNQLLGRQKKANTARAKLIGQMIRSLLSNGGNFDLAIEKSHKKLAILEKGEGDYYWDPVGYEVIRFDEWLRYKSKKHKNKIVPDEQ